MAGFGLADAEEFVSYGEAGIPLAERLDSLLVRGVTALVVIPCDTALEVCAELRKRGIRIPDDLSLITRDFAGVAEFWDPPLTVLRPDYAAMSASARSAEPSSAKMRSSGSVPENRQMTKEPSSK